MSQPEKLPISRAIFQIIVIKDIHWKKHRTFRINEYYCTQHIFVRAQGNKSRTK